VLDWEVFKAHFNTSTALIHTPEGCCSDRRKKAKLIALFLKKAIKIKIVYLVIIIYS
jgi:hypothetical protein